MTRPAAIILTCLLACGSVAFSAERNPPPEFESGHQLPTITQPAARAQALEYVDLGVLVLALAAGSYLALRLRSRRGLLVLMILSIGYFGFYRQGCICPIGAIQNVALTVFENDYAIPLTAGAFFLLPLAFALLSGRTFCASVCPLGGLQDLVSLHPVKLPAHLQHALGMLPFVYLALAVLFAATGSAFIICQYDPFVGFFRLGGSLEMILLGALMLVIGLFIARPYCRFVCPYGALLGLLSRLSWRHVTITPTQCIQCRLCENACPFGAINPPRPPLSPRRRSEGRWLLAVLLVLAPVLSAGGAWGGRALAPAMARMHPTTRLAQQVYLEDAGKITWTTNASIAFRDSGVSTQDLYAQADIVAGRFSLGCTIIGGVLGLLLACKLISLTIRRTSADYTIDRGRCLSCGRCMRYCPMEQNRLKKLHGEAPGL